MSFSLDWPLSRDEQRRQVLRLYDRDVSAADKLLQSGEATLETLRNELSLAQASVASSLAAANVAPLTACARCASESQKFKPPYQDDSLPLPSTPPHGAKCNGQVKTFRIHGSPLPRTAGVNPVLRPDNAYVGSCDQYEVTSSAQAEASAVAAAEAAAEAAERLQLAVVEAAAALAALLGATSATSSDETRGNLRCQPQLAILDASAGEGTFGCSRNSMNVKDTRQIPEPQLRARSEGAAREGKLPPSILLRGRRSSRGRRVSFAEDTDGPPTTGSDDNAYPKSFSSRSEHADPKQNQPVDPSWKACDSLHLQSRSQVEPLASGNAKDDGQANEVTDADAKRSGGSSLSEWRRSSSIPLNNSTVWRNVHRRNSESDAYMEDGSQQPREVQRRRRCSLHNPVVSTTRTPAKHLVAGATCPQTLISPNDIADAKELIPTSKTPLAIQLPTAPPATRPCALALAEPSPIAAPDGVKDFI